MQDFLKNLFLGTNAVSVRTAGVQRYAWHTICIMIQTWQYDNFKSGVYNNKWTIILTLVSFNCTLCYNCIFFFKKTSNHEHDLPFLPLHKIQNAPILEICGSQGEKFIQQHGQHHVFYYRKSFLPQNFKDKSDGSN